ncbi:hypothetical protein C8P68_104328 [Mucilaginibacter yixingensis]|uniref:Uncharacterized protein n=1 Tax=Mucilaginibacter yixingensis TaxID=1295612 RepID=A0A2T5J9V7_9SPHI|nr:hypothetical protein [Mucilaginibacter yixingensis]PTQ96837.1 hypothetical protein C8P68_104328 [Mucilaginibacter yixingensis]
MTTMTNEPVEQAVNNETDIPAYTQDIFTSANETEQFKRCVFKIKSAVRMLKLNLPPNTPCRIGDKTYTLEEATNMQ